MKKRYRIGEIANLSGLTMRTIRYYGELGLLSEGRTSGGQRYYSDQDLVYLKRIIELKDLGFSLDEISKIIKLKKEDESGNKRREELIRRYRMKLGEDEEKLRVLKAHIDELEWHISQLESAGEGFRSCPGALCIDCSYKDKCRFYEAEG